MAIGAFLNEADVKFENEAGGIDAAEAELRATELAAALRRELPFGDLPAVYAVAPAHNGHSGGSIGVRFVASSTTGEPAPLVDLVLGDPARAAGSETYALNTSIPWSEAPERLARLLKAFKVERCARETFDEWVGKQRPDDLRRSLGLPAVTK